MEEEEAVVVRRNFDVLLLVYGVCYIQVTDACDGGMVSRRPAGGLAVVLRGLDGGDVVEYGVFCTLSYQPIRSSANRSAFCFVFLITVIRYSRSGFCQGHIVHSVQSPEALSSGRTTFPV